MIAQAQVDAVSSQLADLEAELRDYEAIRERGCQVEGLSVVVCLPALLIRARIARGLSQRELADLMGLKKQQIQRYEATDYATAKWSRIREVADVLSMGMSGPTQPEESPADSRSIEVLSGGPAMKRLNNYRDVRNHVLCVHCGEGLRHIKRSREHAPTEYPVLGPGSPESSGP